MQEGIPLKSFKIIITTKKLKFLKVHFFLGQGFQDMRAILL